ncbi:GIR2 [Candida margitis]|uniref:GIR2 n=1 Tax=Candida margitis TaxID=1775924 RepID=UPI0022271243|nr:GIR2 [Candida margitis]KAI5970219.1 GIR2 [Candida margitis]
MDHQEEQSQEVEILQSIYPDELEFLNDSQTHFQIRTNLDTDSERKHALYLVVKYPKTYPEVVPDLHIEVAEVEGDREGDSDDAGYDDDEDEDEEAKQTRLALNMAETIEYERDDLSKLLSKLNEEAEISIGMPSIFTLVTVLKDEAESLFNDKLIAKTNEFERKRNELEKIEQQKFQGTKVTRESYNEWRLKFRQEMKFEEKDQLKMQLMHGGRLTGKQIFERGLAGTEEEDGAGNGGIEGDELAEGVKNISV